MKKYLKDFIGFYPSLVKNMNFLNHGYKNDFQNPYHLEGSVWSHTLLTLYSLNYSNVDCDKKLLYIALLLHDIGKIYTYKDNDKKEKRYFINHANISAFKSLDILENFKNSWNLTKQDMIFIFKLIHFHDFFINRKKEKIIEELKCNKYFFKMLTYISYFDNKGRISYKKDMKKINDIFEYLEEIDV